MTMTHMLRWRHGADLRVPGQIMSSTLCLRFQLRWGLFTPNEPHTRTCCTLQYPCLPPQHDALMDGGPQFCLIPLDHLDTKPLITVVVDSSTVKSPQSSLNDGTSPPLRWRCHGGATASERLSTRLGAGPYCLIWLKFLMNMRGMEALPEALLARVLELAGRSEG